jgi:hypothetical protein
LLELAARKNEKCNKFFRNEAILVKSVPLPGTA